MSHTLKRALIIASFIWVLLIAAGAYLAYPTIGTIASSITPNPFWLVEATGDAAAPFRVLLKTSAWIAWTLAPVAAMWLVALSIRRVSTAQTA